MTTLKSYLFPDNGPEVESSYRRMMDLFLQAISLHAVEGDQTEFERFRSDMAAFGNRLTADLSLSNRLLVVGEVIRALGEYNRHTSKFLSIQSTELQKMIAMLTRTVIAVGTSSETSVARLQEIEKTMEQARFLDDIRSVKAQLGDCLERVRGEATRHKAEGKALVETLQQQLADSKDLSAGASRAVNLDPATGLADKAEAQRALEQAANSQEVSGKFVLIAVVNRMRAVNARFGYNIGDQILGMVAEYFRRSLPAEDKLCRWQGPALLAILSRKVSLTLVRHEIRRFAEARLEKTFVVGERSIMLPVSTSWTVFPLIGPADAMLRRIEIFTSAQVAHDYV
jgi:GGDEF domain-containing protein